MEMTNVMDIKRFTESLPPIIPSMTRETVKVEVSLRCYDSLADQLFTQASFKSYHALSCSPEEVRLMYSGLTIMRVGYILASLGLHKLPRVMAISPKTIHIPAHMYFALSALGEVLDDNLAYRFVPVIKEGESEIRAVIDALTPDVVQKVVSVFLQLEGVCGFEMTTGLPKELKGSYGYIMILRAQELICPSNQGTQADAAIAAIMRNVGYMSALRYPFRYGDISNFTAVEAELVSSSFAERSKK